MVNAIAKVQSGTDRTAAELALVRLNRELINIRQRIANAIPLRPPKPMEPLYLPTKSGWLRLFDEFDSMKRTANKKAKEEYLKKKQRYDDAMVIWQGEAIKAEHARTLLVQEEQEILDQIAANEKVVRRPIE